jgi:hypothetical protein
MAYSGVGSVVPTMAINSAHATRMNPRVEDEAAWVMGSP